PLTDLRRPQPLTLPLPDALPICRVALDGCRLPERLAPCEAEGGERARVRERLELAPRELGALRCFGDRAERPRRDQALGRLCAQDRKSTRLNSSHEWISYAVFCL